MFPNCLCGAIQVENFGKVFKTFCNLKIFEDFMQSFKDR